MQILYLKKGWNVRLAAQHLGMTSLDIEEILVGRTIFDELPASLQQKYDEIFSSVEDFDDEVVEEKTKPTSQATELPLVIEYGWEGYVKAIAHLFTTRELKLLQHLREHNVHGLAKLLGVTQSEREAIITKAKHLYTTSEFCKIAERVFIQKIHDEQTLVRLILLDDSFSLQKRSLVAFMCLDTLERKGDSPIPLNQPIYDGLTNEDMINGARIILTNMSKKYPFIHHVFEIQRRWLA